MKISVRILTALGLGGALGAILGALSPGRFLPGFAGAWLLSGLSIFLLLTAWLWAGAGRTLAWMMAAAFFLRLVVGVSLSLALPKHGYDEPTQNSGYLFYDAYRRDQEAWGLVKDPRPLGQVLWVEFDTDQYGGLLLLEGVIYRWLSPDAQRPFLVLILCAFAAAVGLPFLQRSLQQRWNVKVANLASWLLAIYPDGVLFGSSQMREPFLIAFTCLGIWAVLSWRQSRLPATIVAGVSVLGMSFFSNRVALAVAGVLLGWFWLENLAPRSKAWRLAGIPVLAVGLLVLFWISWGWLRSSAMWDFILTERQSGRVQTAIEEIGRTFRVPFIVLYGLAQPVLPAAIAAPALPIWKVVAILRAVGWYALAPLLLYGILAAFKARPGSEKVVLLWFGAAILFWLLLSSARGGGDQWDNPRYRTLFLPFMAAFAAWAVCHCLEKRDAWLVRGLLVELIFLGFFTSWYFSRYYKWWGRMPFWQMVAWIVGLSALVLASGWLWDARRGFRRRRG